MSNEIINCDIIDDVDAIKTQLLEQKESLNQMSRDIRAILERLSLLIIQNENNE
jgi:hypothetical protein